MTIWVVCNGGGKYESYTYISKISFYLPEMEQVK